MATDGTINRRGLFAGTAAAALGLAAVRRDSAFAAPQIPPAILMSAARIGGIDSGALMDADGLSAFALPARAHALTRLPGGEVVMVGRRPGKYAAIVDPARLPDAAPRFFGAAPGYRFVGHAAVDAEGAILTSEMHAETAHAIVVKRDGRTGARQQMWPAGGLEPHELIATDGRLVVAMGGIAKAADVPGPAMNAGKLDSAIVELDSRSGAILHRHTLPAEFASLSLRHMALAPDGKTIAFAMQDQDRSRTRPLIGLLRLGQGIELLAMPDEDGLLRSYLGSVAFDASGRFIAATSPKGGVAGLWRASDGRWLGGLNLADVCGLAVGGEGLFWLTSGMGDVVSARASEDGWDIAAHWRTGAQFDNHLLKL